VSLAAVLEGREVVVCAGPGGVGKTTSAAAVALGLAARGKKVVVLTIDPARRLAGALGLPELGNEEHRVDPERLGAAGIDVPGELWATMLDAKRTWDALVERHAPDERTRQAVLSNRIYRELSSAVAGSQEYMAMEKLNELHADGRYDVLVLDTPPTRNALDFLDAPERLTRFIDSRSLAFFLKSNRRGMGLLGLGSTALFSVLRRVTGVDLLEDLAEFFRAFGAMTEGFEARARAVRALLESPRTSFLVVSSPAPEAVEEAVFFHRRLQETGLPFGAAVVNRVRPLPTPAPDGELEAELATLLDPALARRVMTNVADLTALAERDAVGIERLRSELGAGPMLLVPELSDDVHDLRGLVEMQGQLFGSSPAAGSARAPQTGAE